MVQRVPAQQSPSRLLATGELARHLISTSLLGHGTKVRCCEAATTLQTRIADGRLYLPIVLSLPEQPFEKPFGARRIVWGGEHPSEVLNVSAAFICQRFGHRRPLLCLCKARSQGFNLLL